MSFGLNKAKDEYKNKNVNSFFKSTTWHRNMSSEKNTQYCLKWLWTSKLLIFFFEFFSQYVFFSFQQIRYKNLILKIIIMTTSFKTKSLELTWNSCIFSQYRVDKSLFWSFANEEKRKFLIFWLHANFKLAQHSFCVELRNSWWTNWAQKKNLVFGFWHFIFLNAENIKTCNCFVFWLWWITWNLCLLSKIPLFAERFDHFECKSWLESHTFNESDVWTLFWFEVFHWLNNLLNIFNCMIFFYNRHMLFFFLWF